MNDLTRRAGPGRCSCCACLCPGGRDSCAVPAVAPGGSDSLGVNTLLCGSETISVRMQPFLTVSQPFLIHNLSVSLSLSLSLAPAPALALALALALSLSETLRGSQRLPHPSRPRSESRPGRDGAPPVLRGGPRRVARRDEPRVRRLHRRRHPRPPPRPHRLPRRRVELRVLLRKG